ncbi:MAG: hypothetical protein ACC628_22815 [Pirellulaceae bacterium]
MKRRRFWLCVGAVLLGTVGCGEKTPNVDDAPFRQAIVAYLRSNNMALAIKAVKQGPVVDGRTAELRASLTHETLGGPSVTWTFYFERQGDLWQVTRHED